jgi:ribulose 1,5-bisphosphate carboxylase large subunit-like protein
MRKHYELLGTKDFILVVGKNLYDHPKGIRAGANKLRESADLLQHL